MSPIICMTIRINSITHKICIINYKEFKGKMDENIFETIEKLPEFATLNINFL